MQHTTRAVRQERNGTDGWYYPDHGLWLPRLAGADDDPPKPDPEPDPTPDPTPQPDPKPDPEPEPEPEPWDEARARRTIEKQRVSEKAALDRAKAAEAKLKEIEDAQLSEQEKIVRDRDEARAEAENAKRTAEHLTIDAAIRDELIDQDVDPKRLRRAVKLVERDDIKVENGKVPGADEAVEQFFVDFPEFKKAMPDPDPDPKKPEPPGGNADRRRGKGEMTPEQSDKLLKTDPDEWNRRFEAGEIPASALR